MLNLLVVSFLMSCIFWYFTFYLKCYMYVIEARYDKLTP